MARAFVCCNCGKIFDYPEAVEESRGEYWGMPAYETMYYSPCCTYDFEEVEVDGDGNIINKEVDYEMP